MRSLCAGLLVTCLAACPKSGAGPGAGGGPKSKPRPLAEEIALLTIPPRGETIETLERLDARADDGETEAGWARLHYLIDLFDDARFRRDDDSLAVLEAARNTGGGRRGKSATDATLAFLIVEADRVLGSDRLHAGAVAARTLLEFDARPPARRDDVFQRMVELKTIARGGGPLADNAKLRLFGFCRFAFFDAVKAPMSTRSELISFCLYPLYDSDPAPYFAQDLKQRPPPPRWGHLSERMTELANEVAAGDGRLARAGGALSTAWSEFVDDERGAMPAPHDPEALGVPTVERAEPYAGVPLLAIGDGQAIASREILVETFGKALLTDWRGSIAVAMFGESRAGSLYTVAGALAEAGGDRLELAVGYSQKLDVPEGDYWHGRTTDGQVARVGVIPVSLAKLEHAEPPDSSADAPRALDWDPRRAQLGLHLVIEPERWRLVAPTGILAAIDTDGDPAAELRKQLARVRSAFGDEDGLVLVLGTGATYGALIRAATAARHDADGRRLFPRLALATGAPSPKRSKLRRRIDRRAGAAVALTPDTLAPRVPIVRRCYQDLLERSPRAGGEIRVELSDGEPHVVSGPRNEKLRACVLAGLAAPMKQNDIASATATLSAK